jgi:hypothetical protein
MNKRLLVIVLVALLATAVGALPSAADISLTQTNQAILSCNDGHSVILGVDSSTLATLTAEVESINTSGTGLSCTLDTTTLAASAQATDWTVYDYNPSNNALAPRDSPNKMPATTSGNTTMFNFIPEKYTALLTTDDPSLTGDLSSTTLTDQIVLSGSPGTTFMTQHNGGDCVSNVPAAVRFYFVSPSASGSSVGTPPAGFYTRFWWSNPVHMKMLSDGQTQLITADMFNPGEWSDWNGQNGANPAVTPAFEKAIRNVQTIGLSFGGNCFFETGVVANYTTAPPPYETFSSTFSESP